jgi:hypothetical protein
MRKIILSIVLAFALVNVLFAGEISVKATLEPTEILIGEQAKYTIELTQPASEKVSWPQFADTLATNVQILEKLKTDTLEISDGRISITSEYLVSSYDSGFYYVPEFVFETTTEKVVSNPVGLTVNTVQVNEQTDDINAEKAIMSAPFSWVEFARWTGIGLAGILILVIIALLLMRFVFNKKVKILPTQPEVILPAHVVALQKLEQIRTEKIWQQGQIKQFYTDITDVIREYLEKGYDINAMELTTDEIVALVKKNKDLDEIRVVLKEMLELSDLVKFAKFVPLENENERVVLNAFMIVEKTTKEEAPADASATTQNPTAPEQRGENNENQEKTSQE